MPRKEYGFFGPEGRYPLWPDGYFRHTLTNRELGDLAPCPSRLVTRRISANSEVVVAALRTEVSWHVNHGATAKGKLTYNDTGDESATSIALGGPAATPKLLIGFSNGEVALHDLATSTADWFNYDMELTVHPATALAWISETQFMCAHLNGEVFVHSTELDTTAPLKAPRKKVGDVVLSRAKKGKSNPTHLWTFGKPPRPVLAMSLSPDRGTCACADRSGKLTLIDVKEDTVTTRAQLTHFGALNCVAWSPDGRFVAGGGEDDLISIWSCEQNSKVAAGFGHASWLMAVTFDPYCQQSSPGAYRIISVGQDGRVNLWDLDPARCQGEAAVQAAAHPRKNTASLTLTGQGSAHDDPITAVVAQERYIVTACTGGQVKFWKRPVIMIATSV